MNYGYVLKLTDPEYFSQTYIGKGSILSEGCLEWFLKASVFETREEAMAHIQTCIDSGWYRPDITPANFELVEVKQYPDVHPFFYYTEDAAKRFWEKAYE